MPRGRPRRRAHISSYVTAQVATDLDEAADHHSISLSELVNRILHKATNKGFPTDSHEFQEQYPPNYE